jgi:hypothetical protein
MKVESIYLNDSAEIIFTLGDFRGKNYLDIRIYTGKGDKQTPSLQGIPLDVRLFRQFKRALDKAEVDMIKAGWLDREDLT